MTKMRVPMIKTATTTTTTIVTVEDEGFFASSEPVGRVLVITLATVVVGIAEDSEGRFCRHSFSPRLEMATEHSVLNIEAETQRIIP